MGDCSFDTHIFKEGQTYVAYVPAFDVSSCGATDEEARRNILDAVRGFLATSADMGTLDEILQEGGYERDGETFSASSGCSNKTDFVLIAKNGTTVSLRKRV